MPLQARGDVAQLVVDAGHDFFELNDWYRRTDASDNVFSLRVHQELAIKLFVAGSRIARETDAGAAGVAEVAKHHGLHIDCGAQFIGDVVDAAVVFGTFVVPGAKHGVACHHQLLVRILRKIALGILPDDLLVFFKNFLQRLSVEVGVEFGFLLPLLGVEYFVERGLRNLQHDVPEHLDEAAVRVSRETWVVAAFGESLHASVVQAKIENRVHHSRHGELRARTHADQQRVLTLAELLTLQLFQSHQRFFHLAIDFGRNTGTAHVLATCLGLNGEAGRHGKPGVGHLGEAGAFAAQFVFHLAIAVGLAVAKEVHVLGGWFGLRLHFCFRESCRRHN